MLLLKVKNTDILVCVFKQEDGLYGVTSCDSEGHEGLLADNLVTLKELKELLANVFGQGQKYSCEGIVRNVKQLTKLF